MSAHTCTHDIAEDLSIIVASRTEKQIDERDPIVVNIDAHFATSPTVLYKGSNPVAYPLSREHTTVWPAGRMNHYLFNMNAERCRAIVVCVDDDWGHR